MNDRVGAVVGFCHYRFATGSRSRRAVRYHLFSLDQSTRNEGSSLSHRFSRRTILAARAIPATIICRRTTFHETELSTVLFQRHRALPDRGCLAAEPLALIRLADSDIGGRSHLSPTHRLVRADTGTVDNSMSMALRAAVRAGQHAAQTNVRADLIQGTLFTDSGYEVRVSTTMARG